MQQFIWVPKIYEFILTTQRHEQVVEAIFTSFLLVFGRDIPCRSAPIKGAVVRLYSHQTAFECNEKSAPLERFLFWLPVKPVFAV
jgi:hypothetical protein